MISPMSYEKLTYLHIFFAAMLMYRTCRSIIYNYPNEFFNFIS